ncbi:hypothetical protein D3C85_1146270 [compost metagenome]
MVESQLITDSTISAINTEEMPKVLFIHIAMGAPIAIPAYMAIPFQVITLPDFWAPTSPIPQVKALVMDKLSDIP